MKNQVDIIAIDIDNTLIDHSGNAEISDETISVVREASGHGIHIVLASGRGYMGTTQFAKTLGIRDYTIASVGAHIIDPDGKMVYAKHIDPQVTAGILRYAADRSLYFQVYLDDAYYYLEQTEYTALYEGVLGYFGKADPDLLSKKINAAKLLLAGKPERMIRVRAELAELFPSVTLGSSAPLFVEATANGANKGVALAWLADKLCAPRERILAIGDSDIDISMLRYAGVGVAVANADEAVKEAADYICESKSGVVEAIRKFAL